MTLQQPLGSSALVYVREAAGVARRAPRMARARRGSAAAGRLGRLPVFLFGTEELGLRRGRLRLDGLSSKRLIYRIFGGQEGIA
jgi:hypothetical protein